MELEQVAARPQLTLRPNSEALFIERLQRGDAVAFEQLVNERSGEIYGLLYRLTENREEAETYAGNFSSGVSEYQQLSR